MYFRSLPENIIDKVFEFQILGAKSSISLLDVSNFEFSGGGIFSTGALARRQRLGATVDVHFSNTSPTQLSLYRARS